MTIQVNTNPEESNWHVRLNHWHTVLQFDWAWDEAGGVQLESRWEGDDYGDQICFVVVSYDKAAQAARDMVAEACHWARQNDFTLPRDIDLEDFPVAVEYALRNADFKYTQGE